MTEKRAKTTQIRNAIATLVFVFAILGTVTIIIHSGAHTGEYYFDIDKEPDSFNAGWIIESPSGRNFYTAIPFECDTSAITISRRIDSARFGDIISLHARENTIIARKDGEIFFSVNADEDLSRQYRVDREQFILLPEGERGQSYNLSLTFVSPEGDSVSVPSIETATWHVIFANILKQEMLVLLNLLFIAMLGLVGLALLIVTFIYERRIRDTDKALWVLMFLIITVVIWGATDSPMLQLVGIHSELLGIINYYAFIFLPMPAILFFWEMLGRKISSKLMILVRGYNIFIAVQVLLTHGKLIRINALQPLNYAAMAFCIVVGITLVLNLKDYNIGDFPIRLMSLSFSWFFIILISSVVLEMRVSSRLSRIVMLLGFSVFLLMLFAIVLDSYYKAFSERVRMEEQIYLLSKDSREDPMTKLGNRRAFEEDVVRFDNPEETPDNAVCMFFDLDDLKNVNDKLGHDAGDRLIVNASHVIRDAYSETGKCYRIGGDEFAVIISPVLPENLSELNDNFKELVDNYNAAKPVTPLSISKGASLLIDEKGFRKSVSDWKEEADIKMYADKLRRGAARGIV